MEDMRAGGLVKIPTVELQLNSQALQVGTLSQELVGTHFHIIYMTKYLLYMWKPLKVNKVLCSECRYIYLHCVPTHEFIQTLGF